MLLILVAIGGGGAAFAAFGAAIGAAAREVRASSLLAFMLSLPIAFLSLVPSGTVSAGVFHVIEVVRALFPFDPALDAMNGALDSAGPSVGLPLVHLRGDRPRLRCSGPRSRCGASPAEQMPSTHTIVLFAIASAGLVAIPGPAVIYIVTRGVVHGRHGALVSVMGVEIGNYVEVIAASAGLAAVIASSATAFTVVKLVGATYLIWLGIRTLLEGAVEETDFTPQRSHRRLFWQGFAVGALNPKLAIFLLAFLPQFIDAGAGPVWLQTLVLGTIFSVTAAIGDTLIALAASRAGSTLRTRLTGHGRLSRAAGVVYVGLGVTAALADGGTTD